METLSAIRKLTPILLTCLMAVSVLFVVPLMPEAHALTGLVCLADASTNPDSCPSSSESFTAAVGSNFTVVVNVQDSDSFNGFDIKVNTDPSVIQPVATDLSGMVFPSDVRLIVVNQFDSAQGTARVAAVALAFFTPSPTTGHLFSITYKVVGEGGASIFFPSGCSGSSNDSFCVTLTNPNGPGGVVAENLLTASFGIPTPDFTILASPDSLAVFPGESAKSTIFLASIGSFSGTIDLSTSPPPMCLTCPSWSISPSQVTLSAGGSAIASLAFTTLNSTAPSLWTVIVSGTSGSLTHTATVSFAVNSPPPPSPDFVISANPSSMTVQAGSSVTSMISLTSTGGFSGNVNLFSTISPTGPSVSLTPDVVSLPPNGDASSTLIVSTSNATVSGNYSILVTATSGSITHSVNLALDVFSPPLTGKVCIAAGDTMSCPASPASFTLTTGSQLTVSVNVEGSDALNGFDITVVTNPAVLQPVSASLDGTLLQNPFLVLNSVDSTIGTVRVAAVSVGFIMPAPATGRFFAITYSAVGPGNSEIGFSTGVVTNPNLPGGVDPETLQSAGATVQQPDFSISASQASLTVPLGGSTSTMIILASLGGFAGQVTLSVSVAPSNPAMRVKRLPSATLDPSSVVLSPGGSAISTLTISVPRSGTVGLYVLTITATRGSISHTITISLTVPPRR